MSDLLHNALLALADGLGNLVVLAGVVLAAWLYDRHRAERCRRDVGERRPRRTIAGRYLIDDEPAPARSFEAGQEHAARAAVRPLASNVHRLPERPTADVIPHPTLTRDRDGAA